MGKCLICRHDGKPLLKSTSDSDNYDPEGNQTHRSWATTCINSLCTLIKIPEFQYLFLNANYCEACMQLIRDIDFSLQQISNFQKQILGFRDHIFTELGQNYEAAVANAAVGTTDQLSFDDKVKIVYPKINEGSKSWTSTDFMDTNPPKNHQRILNVLEEVKIEANEENESIEEKEEFILPSVSQEIYKENNEVNKNIVVFKDEPLIEQDMDLNEEYIIHPDGRCSNAEEESNFDVPQITFEPQNVLDDLKTDDDMKSPKDEKNSKGNDSRRRRKQNLVSYKEIDDAIPQDMDLNEDNSPDWNCSDAESLKDDEDHFGLKRKKTTGIKDSRPFHCDFCEAKYRYKPKLLDHMDRMHSKCTFCGMRFETQEEQNEHEKIHKNSDTPFKCTITNCDQVFTNSTELEQHTLTHTDNRPICDVCGKNFQNIRYLKRHRKIHDDSLVGFLCTVCNKKFLTASKLAAHMENHSDERKYRCDVCGALFKKSSYLKVHKKSHSEAKFICKICGRGFSLVGRFNKHKEIHSLTLSYECKICCKKFKAKANLQHHVKIHRPTVLKKPEEKCRFCFMDCETKEKLDEHENIHKNSDKPFKCTICDEVCTNSLTLKQHMFTHDEGRLICDVCGKSFAKLPHLTYHRRVRHDDSFVGHPCTVCNKKLATPYELTKHMESHSDEKKFICDVCGAGFKQEKPLNVHKRKHDGDFKFICQICGKGFTSSTMLIGHEEIHSGTLAYECKICLKRFRARNNLSQHLKTHEPKDPNKKKRIRPNRTKLSSQANKIKAKANRTSVKYQDSSSSDCESEEDSGDLIEEDAKKSAQCPVQELQVQAPQYPSASTQQFQPVFYNMPHSNFQYPNQ